MVSTYDPRVEELARVFLEDENLSGEWYAKAVVSLSCAIQSEIEAWFDDLNDKRESEAQQP